MKSSESTTQQALTLSNDPRGNLLLGLAFQDRELTEEQYDQLLNLPFSKWDPSLQEMLRPLGAEKITDYPAEPWIPPSKRPPNSEPK